MTDPDTDNQSHIAPVGLEHQEAQTSKKGIFYSSVKMRHYIINLHQEAFPELAEKMKNNNNAANIYSAFLALIPLEIKGRLTPDLRKQILKTFKLT